MTRTKIAAKPMLALTLAAFVLTGCAAARESRLNPFNWFGGSREVAEVEEGEINPLLPRRSRLAADEEVYPGIPIDQITDLRIERIRSGAIILVEGLAERQGPYEVQLTPANEDEEPEDGVLTYTFDVVYPRYNTAVGPEQTRRVTAARSIGNVLLEQVRVIRVVGARNSRESRRP